MPRAKHACIICSSQVRQLHTALKCEECNRWQHLRCGTGISQSFYWKVVRCLGVFEWSCSACSTSTQSEGNETSQISPQPKRRCSGSDGDDHPIIPAKRRRPASVTNQVTTPVPSQPIAPVSSRPAAPVSSQSTVTMTSWPAAPVSSQFTATVTSRPAAQVSSQPAAPVSSRHAAPVSSQSTATVTSRPAAPVSSQSTATVSSRPAAPVSSQSTPPVSSQSAAPVSSRSTAPVSSQSTTPVSSQPVAPVSSRPAAPVSSQSPAPVSRSVHGSYSIYSDSEFDSNYEEKEHVTFTIMEKGSNQDFPLLLSSDGYDYHARHYNKKKWGCSLSSCRTFVDQDGDTFKYGPRKHCHPPRPFLRLSREMALEAREKAVKYPLHSTYFLARHIYDKAPKNATDIPGLFKLMSIVKSTRRKNKMCVD